MNIKKTALSIVFAAMFAVILSLNVFGETLNSSIYTAEGRESFKGFEGKTVSSAANLNWRSENGEKITRTPVRYLPANALTVNAPGASRVKASFSSSPAKAVDLAMCGQIYFAVRYETAEQNVKYTFDLTLGDGEDTFIASASLAGNSWILVSFEVGIASPGKSVRSMKAEFFSNSKSSGKIYMAGPYSLPVDRTYEEELCLGDVRLADGVSGNGSEITVLESSQKIGFSGRFLRPQSKPDMNFLRAFITTGSVGGNLEVRYSYLSEETGKLTTESYTARLEDSMENNSYMIPLDNADRVISLSFLFDAARIGEITVHKIEAVGIYSADDKMIYGEIGECSYSRADGTIKINGRIFHNFLIKHDNYELLCFRLEAGDTLRDAVNKGSSPVATSKMSSEFKMTYKAGKQDKPAAVSKYTVVAWNGEEYIEILPPFYAELKQSGGETDAYKGICSTEDAELWDSGAQVSVVDVYLDRLTNSGNSGYLYSVDGTHIYYSSEYVEALDKRIKNLYSCGCRVYLRLLIGADRGSVYLPYASRAGSPDAIYSAIEVESREGMLHLLSAVDFLTSRYSGRTRGRVSGYILGTALNFPKRYNMSSAESLVDYTDRMALTLEIIAHSAVLSSDGIKMIVPVSADVNAVDGGYDPELFLTSLCNRLDEFGGLEFTAMLESSSMDFATDKFDSSVSPFTSDSIGNIIPDPLFYVTSSAHPADIGFETMISELEQMLRVLERRSVSLSDKYIFYWNPSASTPEHGLISPFVYMYYRFLFSSSAESFIVRSGEGDMYFLNQIFKFIDTERNRDGALVSFLLDQYNVREWSELIPGYKSELIPIRRAVFSDAISPPSAKGSFFLFDFKASFGTLDWYASDGSRSLSLSATSGEKSLCAVISEAAGGAELVYCFEYPERLDFAPYLTFNFSVGTDQTEKYSVKITVRSGRNILESERIISGGVKNDLTVDLSGITPENGIDSVKISVERTSDMNGDFIFNLYSVSVLSQELSDAELEKRIIASRDEVKNTRPDTPASGIVDSNGTDRPDYGFAVIMLFILAVLVAAAGIYDRNKEH